MKKFSKKQEKPWFTGKKVYQKSIGVPSSYISDFYTMASTENLPFLSAVSLMSFCETKNLKYFDAGEFILRLGFTNENEVTSGEVFARLAEMGKEEADNLIESCIYSEYPKRLKER